MIDIASELRALLDSGDRRISAKLREACDRGAGIAERKADERRKAARSRGIDLGRLVEDETQAIWIEVVQAPELRLGKASKSAGIIEVVRDASGVKLSRAQRGQSKRLGSKKGWPDLHNIGRTSEGTIVHWLTELKVSGGSVSPDQKKTISRLQSFGVDVSVCWGLADISQVLLDRLLPTSG